MNYCRCLLSRIKLVKIKQGLLFVLFTIFYILFLVKVKNIYVHNEMFSIENGLLTPTLKARRPELKEFFKKKIDELYSSISM